MDRVKLEARIREDLEQLKQNAQAYAENRAEFVEISLNLGRDLLEARGTFRSDPQFGAWLMTSELDRLSHQDRAAILNMARHPKLFKQVLEGSIKRSYRRLYENEFRPLLEVKEEEERKKKVLFTTPGKEEKIEPVTPSKQEEKAPVKPAPYAGSPELINKSTPSMTPHEQWVRDNPKQEGEAHSPKTTKKSEEERIAREVQKQVRIIEAQLRAEAEIRIQQEIKRRLEEMVLPAWRKEIEDAKLIKQSRRGVFTDDQYKLIVRCLHPDSRKSVSDEKLAEAFRLFNENKLVLTKGDNPTRVAPSNPVPRDPAAWVRRSREERAKREAAERGE